MSNTFIVSNRLPVRLDDAGKPVRTTGGLASALAGSGIEATWVGWPGIASEQMENEAQLVATLKESGIVPVILGEEIIDGYYHGYANSTVWPLLHYMIERARFEPEWFPFYEKANRAFAEAILDVVEDSDTVWIHDYHLFLLPRMLRESGKKLRIAFFLHTPFPSSEIFRALSERRKILEGLLGADLIGFHTYNYLRHFRSAVLRVLGVESNVGSVQQEQREVSLGVYPIGHDHRGFSKAMQTAEYQDALNRHAAELAEKKLFISVERLDYTKGIPQKLDAIRLFLKENEAERAKIVFVIIAVPSRGDVDEYVQLTEEVQREVGAINGKYGTVGHAPVQFLHRSFPQPELAALYALADACLVTPLIDGMNLVAKEYIDCKNESTGGRPGVLILSEFAGAAQELSHAIMVNPYDVTETARAITQALTMSDNDKQKRTLAMQDRLRRSDSSAWATTILNEVKAIPLTVREVNATTQFPMITGRVVKAVQEGGRASLFLDYDGTLRDFVSKPEDAVPDPELLPLFDRLCAIPGLDVAVVSGRPLEFLDQHFPNLALTLVAEHGYRWRRPDTDGWELVHEHIDTDWIDVVMPLLEQAVDLTPGSHLEEKQSSIVWHYRQTDPEFGLWRAHGLLAELTDVTASLPVAVHHGKKIVEVASQLVNKGQAVKALISDWHPNIAIVAGDDQTDETMFALELGNELDFVSVKVGDEGATRAKRRTDIRGLRNFLVQLS
ncbi:MAG: bifunctional alpha,alpha-trehalose-phosphate synthase (UDP-forming)/trehalose-phosphatase, partial [Verrucomicrobiales bacterium]